MIATYPGQPIKQVSSLHKIGLLLSQQCCLYFMMTQVGCSDTVLHGCNQASCTETQPCPVPVNTHCTPSPSGYSRTQKLWRKISSSHHPISHEITGLRVTGGWLEDSGLVEALVQAMMHLQGLQNYSLRYPMSHEPDMHTM